MLRELRQLVRPMLLLAMVLGVTAFSLRGLDSLARFAAGPAEDRSFSSVEELESTLRVRLGLPVYFPQSLRWPPISIRVAGHRPPAVALGFGGRDSGSDEELFIFQTLGGVGAIPPRLFKEGVILETREARVGENQATLHRIHGSDGSVWHELAWEQEKSSVSIRSKRSLEELLKIAPTMREEGR